jgi:hypothetical protein
MVYDIYDELFEDMQAGRDRLAREYNCFTHDTSHDRLAQIRKHGLLPHDVGSCPQKVFDQFGATGRQILCLHPVGNELRPRSSHDGPLVRLAVKGADLPGRLGLDWSYDWRLARLIREDTPEKSHNDVLIEVARRRGSIAVYDRIPAAKLRIWKKGLPDDPAQWPRLDEITDAEAHTFD